MNPLYGKFLLNSLRVIILGLQKTSQEDSARLPVALYRAHTSHHYHGIHLFFIHSYANIFSITIYLLIKSDCLINVHICYKFQFLLSSDIVKISKQQSFIIDPHYPMVNICLHNNNSHKLCCY